MSPPAQTPALPRRFVVIGLLAVILPLAAFSALEGLGSLVLLMNDLTKARAPVVAEQIYTRFDDQLGWRSIPGVRLPNLYGPGIGITIDSGGFRSVEVITTARPAGRRRLICSGDSFTFGYGVADDQTWCHLLGSAHWQTVNMGQGGYGLDQAYLWYKADGQRLEHDAHIMAVIHADLNRMRNDDFLGAFAKPRLVVRGDSLVVLNVPLRKRLGGSWPRRRQVLGELRSAQLVQRLRGRLEGRSADSSERAEMTRRVVPRLVSDQADINRQLGSLPVLVFLPSEMDYADEGSRSARALLSRACADAGVTFIDITEDLRRLPPATVDSLFIKAGEVDFVGASGHYNARGNAWVAARLREKLAPRLPGLGPG